MRYNSGEVFYFPAGATGRFRSAAPRSVYDRVSVRRSNGGKVKGFTFVGDRDLRRNEILQLAQGRDNVEGSGGDRALIQRAPLREEEGPRWIHAEREQRRERKRPQHGGQRPRRLEREPDRALRRRTVCVARSPGRSFSDRGSAR